ncbi:MFS transporter [Agromyces sp. H3Y2-19a]|jgi:MFS family permease|uniref:MFS transporter n=1 Tax=Agromyces TaxID=33877 RepID=UPI001E3AB67A|nr:MULTISPECIES: MFS transporter [Agromyces]MCD5345632.1 MFS transporter [Agromyces sp. S2-1-8]MDF0511998.1 MFS transporter [Agromyces chromiiresistens]
MRSFWAALPTEGRWLLSTVAIQTLGRGLTLPFTIIYLHEVRGFDLGVSGTLMGLIAITGLVVTGPGGTLIDRFGAKIVLIVGLVAMIAGCTLLAFATTPAVAAVALVLIGINFGVSWPGFNALIATVVEGDLRQQYFGVNFALVNLGIGVGGIIGGFFVDVDNPDTFTAIFLVDAATSLIPMALLLGPLRHVRTHAEPDEHAAPVGGYREILKRPAVLWLTLVTFISVFIGYGQMEAGFPAYARQVSEVSTQVVGFSFAVNTAVIVLLQFTVLKLIAGHRRTRVMQVMAAVWALSWLVLGATGLLPDSLAAAIGVLAFMGIFAFGETMLQPTVPAIYNDLADDRNRGRYNAINAAAFQGGAITGPVVAGVLLGVGQGAWFIAAMVAGCVLIMVLALALERRVPASANGVAEPSPEPATDPSASPAGPAAG